VALAEAARGLVALARVDGDLEIAGPRTLTRTHRDPMPETVEETGPTLGGHAVPGADPARPRRDDPDPHASAWWAAGSLKRAVRPIAFPDLVRPPSASGSCFRPAGAEARPHVAAVGLIEVAPSVAEHSRAR